MIPDPNSRLFARLIKPELRLGLGFGLGAGARSLSFDIYADSVNGNDSNNGATLNTAYKTIAAARVAALVRGNSVRICLVRGSVWYEDGDLSTLNSILVADGGYAADPMPVFDGSSAAANASFMKTAGQTNIYQIDVNQTLAEGYIAVWEDGVMAEFVSSLAALDALTGAGFYIADDGTGSGKSGPGAHTVYVKASDNSAITSNGKAYRITDPTRLGALKVGNDATVRRVQTQRNMQADGSFNAGFRANIVSCVFVDGVKHNSLIASGAYTRCVAWKGERGQRTGSILMEFYTANGTGYSCVYRDCIGVGDCTSAATPSTQVVVAFGGHNTGTGTYYEQWDAYDCVAHNCNSAFQLEAKSVSATRCLASETFVAFLLNDRGGNPVNLTDPYIVSVNRMLHRGITGLGAVISVDGARFFVNNSATVTGANRILYWPPTGTTMSINRSVAVIKATNSQFYFGYFPQGTGGTLNQTGCIVQADVDRLEHVSYGSGAASLGTMQDNVYYPDANVNHRVNGTSYTSSSAYLTAVQASGKETGTVIANPSFLDAANGNFNTAGTGLPANSGLARPNVAYHPIPATLADARSWAEAA